MPDFITVRNIRVESILRILSTFNPSEFIDVTLVPGKTNKDSDILRISPSGYEHPDVKEFFDLKNINDFI
jgi:hypothetical protein